MPELPEVEHLRRSLEPLILGETIARVRVLRRDVITTPRDPAGGFSRQRTAHLPSRLRLPELLKGDRIRQLHRLGKQLAIEGDSGRVMLVHLGMTGRLTVQPATTALAPHTHVEWSLPERRRMAFADPRRFGGIWTFNSLDDLRRARWDQLGPDALTIRTTSLKIALGQCRRPLKAALLDQSVIAGLGNIYADETCFQAELHPQRPAKSLSNHELSCLTSCIRDTLKRAIGLGGSTLRDYTDALGQHGTATRVHNVYGRSGASCTRCGETLCSDVVSGRTTVWCPRCQRP